MGTLTTVGLAALTTLLVTLLSGLILEKLKNIKPKLILVVKAAIPITIENKYVGAYLVDVSNPSSKTIDDISISISAKTALIRNGGINATQGLEFSDEKKKKHFIIRIPFMKSHEKISITAIAEDSFYIPQKPEIVIRSPQVFKLIKKAKINKFSVQKLYLVPGVIGSLSVIIALIVILSFPSLNTTLTYAAERAELYDLVEIFATRTVQGFFPQGPLAYSKAKQSLNSNDIEKYKKFLMYIINSPSLMAPTSKCCLYFYLAKIELLQSETKEAIQHFDKAKNVCGFFFKQLIKNDNEVKSFLNKQILNK